MGDRLVTEEEFLERNNRDGGFAFPGILELLSGATLRSGGMSLRHWYAGQALQGLIAGAQYSQSQGIEDFLATKAVNFADAMIKALERSH